MTLSITALGPRYCYAECQKAICRLCWVCHKWYTWPKIHAKDKHSSLHWEHVFCSKTIWSTQLFWSTLALADTFLVDKMIWPTHFWSTKWFGRHFGWHIFCSTKFFVRPNVLPTPFLSTKCFGRLLFCRQNLLVDKIFWSTKKFYQHIFGWQNDLADNIFLSNTTLLWTKKFYISMTLSLSFNWLGHRSLLMLCLCRPIVCRSNCFRWKDLEPLLFISVSEKEKDSFIAPAIWKLSSFKVFCCCCWSESVCFFYLKRKCPIFSLLQFKLF